MKTEATGIYIHIPFCAGKCPYCDFYSGLPDKREILRYTDKLAERIEKKAESLDADGLLQKADTLYFGGGTPSLLGAENLSRLISTVRKSFGLTDSPEITVEVNPCCRSFDFEMLKNGGANRISIGLQSADDSELRILGRRHSLADAEKCIIRARQAGFDNISLDLMIATPGQTHESLKRSVSFCTKAGAEHISAYILKLEPGTEFYRIQDSLLLPDEDKTAELYELMCQLLHEAGYEHYEISNFCRSGHEGRHNLRYWLDEEYLGFGPSAHSFFGGRRYYCPRSMEDFYSDITIDDGPGGDEEEFIMLGLRLSGGITDERFLSRFGHALPEKYKKRAAGMEASGLVKISDNGFALTEKGFLVSNAVIGKILD